MDSIGRGDDRLFGRLLEAGADPLARDDSGNIALVYAIVPEEIRALANLATRRGDLEKAIVAAEMRVCEHLRNRQANEASPNSQANDKAEAPAETGPHEQVADFLRALLEQATGQSVLWAVPHSQDKDRLLSQLDDVWCALWQAEHTLYLVCMTPVPGSLFGQDWHVCVFDAKMTVVHRGLFVATDYDTPYALVEVRSTEANLTPVSLRGKWLLAVATCFNASWRREDPASCGSDPGLTDMTDSISATRVSWVGQEVMPRLVEPGPSVEIRWAEPGPAIPIRDGIFPVPAMNSRPQASRPDGTAGP